MDHNCWSSINDEIMINYSECLGKGTFSDVFKGFWKSKGCLVAIKKIK
jgi:predicted Ser/Thr protein kinase